MWKFQDFPITPFLREIDFEEFRRSKTAIFANLGALNLVDLVNFSFQKVPDIYSYKSRFRASKWVEMADFALLKSPKLISRKIQMIGKS